MNLDERTEKVRQEALRLGFDACGFARARRLEKEERRLEEWLNQNRNGQLLWMENHFDKRVDPTKLVPGAQSVVSILGSYHHPSHDEEPVKENKPRISKYARGRDYHKVFKKKLYQLYQFTEELLGGLDGRVFVDSAPVLDKAWAVQAGLGWMGKNSNILNKELGSYFFIGEMITDARFVYNEVTTDHCGSCTRCIDACPTDAIYEPYRVDASKCISYFTIELKEDMPDDYKKSVGEWMFGCDICQDVCPWNRDANFGSLKDLYPRDKMLNHDTDFWEELDLEQYKNLFNGTPVRRAKFEKLKQNIDVVAQNLREGLDNPE